MIELEAADRHANLIAPGGERLMQRNGVVEVPDRYAAFASDCVAPRTIFRPRVKAFAGFSAEEIRQRYDEWLESREKAK